MKKMVVIIIALLSAVYIRANTVTFRNTSSKKITITFNYLDPFICYNDSQILESGASNVRDIGICILKSVSVIDNGNVVYTSGHIGRNQDLIVDITPDLRVLVKDLQGNIQSQTYTI
jgi:hypothetical protein